MSDICFPTKVPKIRKYKEETIIGGRSVCCQIRNILRISLNKIVLKITNDKCINTKEYKNK
jgi:hypothetical protein